LVPAKAHSKEEKEEREMRTKMLLAPVLLSLVALTNVAVAQSQGASLDSYIESLRADFRADKVALITEVMKFNDQESKIFWPVYRKYEADLTKVNDQRVTVIKSYADKYNANTMTEADAKAMIDQGLDFESRRTEVKKKYAKEFQKAGLSSSTVAKFMQLEHRLDLVVEVELAYEIPYVSVKPAGPLTPNQ